MQVRTLDIAETPCFFTKYTYCGFPLPLLIGFRLEPLQGFSHDQNPQDQLIIIKYNIKESDTHSYKAFILEHVLEAFLNKLMCSTNKVKVVYVIELHENYMLVKTTHKVQFNEQLTIQYITSVVTRDPKSQPAPRGLTAHVSISSGSLHIRSQNGPS